MSILEAVSSSSLATGFLAQAQYFKAEFNYSQTSQFTQVSGAGWEASSYSSAVTISLSIRAINITTGLLSAEKNVDDSAPDETASDNIFPRAKGIETALKNLLNELAENNGLTGKVAKRLAKLVTILNVARGTDTKLGELDKEARKDVLSARKQVNEFFREKHATLLVGEDLGNFITLISKLETLREFSLRTEDLLAALKGDEGDSEEPASEPEQIPPQINIEA